MDSACLSVLKGQCTCKETSVAAKNNALTIVDLLRQQARLAPQNTAVVCGDFSVTYSNLDSLSDILAAELIMRGVTPGDRVGILTYHDELAFISVFGIIKARAAYVPLNPYHPPPRLLHILDDAGINVVITGEGLEANIAGFTGIVIHAREFLKSGSSYAQDRIELPVPLPDDIIMIEYTSGSTGPPKGVMLSHSNALVFPAYYKKINGLSAGDAVASYANLSFIVHTTDIFATVMAGASVHIISQSIRLDTKMVNEYFEAFNISAALVPYSFGIRFILQEENRSLRSLSLAGEQFAPLPELSRNYRIYNAYGCTETAGGLCLREIMPGHNDVSAGPPIDDVAVYLVDKAGNIVSRGEAGELCVAGPMVGAGYLNRPEKTAEVFVKNPFSDEPGYETLYKTGDLARLTESGSVQITGRVDFQIKIRGYRIEPGEIDACIRRFPGITESVTVAVESKAAEKYLVSYIVSAEVIKPEILKDFISGFLPLYMVPQFVEQLNQLPRNINGKLDRFNLPPPKLHLLGYAPPEGETEEKLAQLWAATLGLDNASISRDSDFLKLGGDSLRAAILAFEISNVMGLQFSPGEIVKTPVLKEQAAIVALAESFQPVFVFSDAGDGKAPLFFVHGGNIGPETLTELAKNLPPDRSFYCFENYNVNHPHARIKGIQGVARHYIKIMREIAPRFPCALGGWSYGGLVAFEMACQLEQAGDTVEHLYLMDPSLIRSRQERELNEKLIATNSYLEYLAKDPWFERIRAMGLFERLSENYRELAEDILEYLPAVLYRGKLTLFKATRPDPVGPDVLPEAAEIRRQLWQITSEKKDNGFGEYAPRLRVVEIDDSHDKLGRGDAAKKIASVIGRS